MPLLNHFQPPLSLHRQWQAIHSSWCNAIVQQLNEEVLPVRYVALPNVRIGGQVEIDVATVDTASHANETTSGTSTAVWAPPRPTLQSPVDFVGLDVFEVQVINEAEGPVPVAAIELVSPANKDRPSHRRAFAVKCVALLQQRVSVIVIDVVTDRAKNLFAEILTLIGVPSDAPEATADLYAFASRALGTGDQSQIETWFERLEIGGPLPTLPLWLMPDVAVPIDFEQSYRAACHSLRIEV